MKIAVVGTGYVGLVTGTCFADMGNTVTCVDSNTEKIKGLNSGEVPIYERGLEDLVHRNQKQGRLFFTTDLEKGITDAKAILLALPTPPGEDGSADLRHILEVADQLGTLLKNYTVIANKSTVPVGTAQRVSDRIRPKATVEFDVVSNPEFLREGLAVEDFLKPERVVVGTRSSRARKIMETLYAPFIRLGSPILFMDEASAELTKYAANAFLATKISYMNEIANLCERVGANVDDVRKGMGADSRIGKRFLFPGIGYGGSCFPKDVKALARSSEESGYHFQILHSVMTVNESQKKKLIPLMKKYFNGNLKGKTIAVWGLSFKPHTDDIREAPSIDNINELVKNGALVKVHDPEAMQNAKKVLDGKVEFCENPYLAVSGADGLFIATEWPEYRNPDFERLAKLMQGKVVFDGRNLYDPETMRSLGFHYFSIGRKAIEP